MESDWYKQTFPRRIIHIRLQDEGFFFEEWKCIACRRTPEVMALIHQCIFEMPWDIDIKDLVRSFGRNEITLDELVEILKERDRALD